jgi:transcriptional regulator with XRE-family HTH domain
MRFPAVSYENLAPVAQIDVYVGRRLRDRRQELGISQGRLGRQLGITFSQIQKYEKGSNRIGAGRLFHIASILGVPVQYFFEELNNPALEVRSNREVAASADAARMQDLLIRISNPNAREALLSLASSMASN